MRTSIMVSNFSWPPDQATDRALARIAHVADDSGIDSVFVADHLLQLEPGTEPTEPMLEAFTALGHLSALTRRIRLGAMVASATLRPPALLIKAVTTLDAVSGGRAWFGIGAGYQRAEADDMGVPFPPVAERFEWLEDTVQLAARMWSGDDGPFVGGRLMAGRPICAPAPSAAPRPPILIGGSGERRTLRLVARYADACNQPDVPDGGALIRRKLGVLAGHCTAVGRPFACIEKTVSTRLEPGDPVGHLVERARALAPLGVDHLVVLTRGPWTPRTVATVASAVSAIDSLPTTAAPDHPHH